MIKDGFVVPEKYKAKYEELGKAKTIPLSFQFPSCSFWIQWDSISTLTLNADSKKGKMQTIVAR
jgi:hypothetical protein